MIDWLIAWLQAEIAEYVKRFNALDEGKKGYVSINDIRRSFKVNLANCKLIIILLKMHTNTGYIFKMNNFIEHIFIIIIEQSQTILLLRLNA